MTDGEGIVSSLPSRPLRGEEVSGLEEASGIEATREADETMTFPEDRDVVFVHDFIIITENTVVALAYSEPDQKWKQVYTAQRPVEKLTDAYDAVRSFRNNPVPFSRAPLTPEAVIHHRETIQKMKSGPSQLSEGDDFECPVCGEIHTVKILDVSQELDGPDVMHVECDVEPSNLLVY